IAEAIVVDSGATAEEIAVELPAALEQMKRAGEIALAEQGERLFREKDLPHARELHLRANLIEHLRPAPEVHDAGELRDGAVGREVDPIEHDLAPLDPEVRRELR